MMAANGTDVRYAANIIMAEEFSQQEYDYLILGGGTARLVLAARLSENPEAMVGVIEAGKNRLNDMLVDVPAMYGQMLGNTEYDWVHQTTPQTAAEGEAAYQLAAGKMLGGSSALNLMM